MRDYRAIIFMFFFWECLCHPIYAQVIQLDSLNEYRQKQIDITSLTRVIRDSATILDPYSLSQGLPKEGVENVWRGKRYFEKERIWLRAELSSKKGGRFYIRPCVSTTTHIYLFKGQELISKKSSGYFTPSPKLDVPLSSNFFTLDLAPSDTVMVLVETTPFFFLPLPVAWDLLPEPEFYQLFSFFLFFQSVFLGAFGIMILYVFFLWLSNRDNAYLWYLFYLLSLAVVYGIGKEMIRLIPIQSSYQASLIFSFAASLPLFIVLLYFTFMRHFLKLKELLPRLEKQVKWLVRIQFALLPLLVLLNRYVIPNSSVQLLTMFVDILMTMYVVFHLVRTRDYLAWIFVAGNIILIVSALLSLILSVLGSFPHNDEDYFFQVGVMLEIVVFSYGLGIRAKMTEEEKRAAQSALFEQQAKEKVELSRQVKLRTQDLNEKNTALSSTLDQLKATQSQLVASERLASIGQLTAGVAHEINNPINFVVGNVAPLKRDLEEIMEVVSQLSHMAKGAGKEDMLAYLKEQDTDYVVEEIQSLLGGIEEGAIRVRDIVQSLRTFSRVSEEQFTLVNIEECLEATLLLLQHELSGKIQVHKAYSPLPLVEGVPGKLNQVLMNLLVNAIQAIPDQGEIWISTELVKPQNQVKIRVEDNGIGMTEDVQRQMFEPFFTTKDQGQGTGLGLSISLGIIKQHGGHIEVMSKLHEGTRMLLYLPVSQAEIP